MATIYNQLEFGYHDEAIISAINKGIFLSYPPNEITQEQRTTIQEFVRQKVYPYLESVYGEMYFLPVRSVSEIEVGLITENRITSFCARHGGLLSAQSAFMAAEFGGKISEMETRDITNENTTTNSGSDTTTEKEKYNPIATLSSKLSGETDTKRDYSSNLVSDGTAKETTLREHERDDSAKRLVSDDYNYIAPLTKFVQDWGVLMDFDRIEEVL